jgi:cell division protein FtsX
MISIQFLILLIIWILIPILLCSFRPIIININNKKLKSIVVWSIIVIFIVPIYFWWYISAICFIIGRFGEWLNKNGDWHQ